MKQRKLYVALVLVIALVVAILSSGSLSASDANATMVPDCDCTIHNYPKPGDTLHGKRDDKGECFATPCATDPEIE